VFTVNLMLIFLEVLTFLWYLIVHRLASWHTFCEVLKDGIDSVFICLIVITE